LRGVKLVFYVGKNIFAPKLKIPVIHLLK